MEWSKTKKYNPNGPGYPEAGYWYVLQSEAEERIEKLQAEVARLKGRVRELEIPARIAADMQVHAEDAEAKLLAVEEILADIDNHRVKIVSTSPTTHGIYKDYHGEYIYLPKLLAKLRVALKGGA